MALIKPHGADELKVLLLQGKELAEEKNKAAKLKKVPMTSREIMGTMKVTVKYTIDKELECKSIYKTNDPAHPGVKMVMEQKAVNLAGPVKVISEGTFPTEFEGIYQRPWESRKMFEERGWRTIAALQLRNPMHRSHEYLAKIALEVLDGLYIHQLVGKLKPGDIPADVRVKCIDKLVEGYFVKQGVIQGGYPLDMRYAGPREGLLHAVFRQNFGCTHMIIGRAVRSSGNFQSVVGRRFAVPAVEDRLDFLVLQVQRNGFDEDLPSYGEGRPVIPLWHNAA